MTTLATLPHSCGRCTNRWAGNNTCHCGSGCHRTFSSPKAFDTHRVRRGQAEGTCVDPAAVDLVLADRAGYQVWGYPGDEAAVERLQARRTAVAE